MKTFIGSIKILFAAMLMAVALSACSTAPDTSQAPPQVVKAQIVNAPPPYFKDSTTFSPVQRSILAVSAETDSTLPVVVQVTFAPPVVGEGLWSWLRRNWWAFLIFGLGVWEIFARVTPTEVDNTVLAVIKRILDLFATNKKIGGGAHPA